MEILGIILGVIVTLIGGYYLARGTAENELGTVVGAVVYLAFALLLFCR